jgi:nitroreductase
MDTIVDAINSHRSIRRYESTAIDAELLDKILATGIKGSSSGNMNTWSVVVTRDQALKEKLYVLHLEQEMVRQAPVVLTFCADFRRMRRWVKLRGAKDSFDDLGGYLIAAIDAVIAAQNVALAAESFGLGICYMGTTLYSAKGISDLLQLPETVIPVTSLVMGVPAENPAPRHRLPMASLVHNETYQDPSNDEILATFKDREQLGWERYRSMPDVMKEIERLGIKHLAEYYTSEAKYSKELHTQISRDYLALLKEKGFWNF